MKKSLHDKFKENANFVRPLYRKVKFGNRVRPMKKLFVSVNIDGVTKPCGDALHVKRTVVTNKYADNDVIEVNSENSDYIRTLPGACDNKSNSYFSKLKINKNNPRHKVKVSKNAPFTTHNLLGRNYMKMEDANGIAKDNKSLQTRNSKVLIEKVPETWLRVYPAPQTADESTASVAFRCVVCQLGLAALLVLWNVLWVFVIHYFECPFETQVAIEFEKSQNQLVIDLATELRQITPLSPKWKHAIEKRIEDERQLTMLAVARGAKLHPGQFWDLGGSFLFSIYVMTALGFGAPVPQTAWGRSSALIHAILAVPTHIFLMVNVSTCVVANIEKRIKKVRQDRKQSTSSKAAIDTKESPDCSRSSEKRKAFILRRKIGKLLKIVYFGRCIPAAAVAYYASGAVAFGALRGRQPLEIVLFPLEFTTTGGLEHIQIYVKVLYGFYVEGAMALLACALATLRSHSSATINFMSEKYRLFCINKE